MAHKKRKQMGQPVVAYQPARPPISLRPSVLDAVLVLGGLTAGTAFSYGVARGSEDQLVKTSGYVLAGLGGFLVLGGLVSALSD